jgi:hypothetical protein
VSQHLEAAIEQIDRAAAAIEDGEQVEKVVGALLGAVNALAAAVQSLEQWRRAQ